MTCANGVEPAEGSIWLAIPFASDRRRSQRALRRRLDRQVVAGAGRLLRNPCNRPVVETSLMFGRACPHAGWCSPLLGEHAYAPWGSWKVDARLETGLRRQQRQRGPTQARALSSLRGCPVRER
jgi:hypothetical protein